MSEPGTGAVDLIDLRGRSAVIVGGSGGIGLGIASVLADQGAEVHITGTKPDAASYDGLDPRLRYHQVDVTDDHSVDNLLPDVRALDILVCAPGAVAYKRKEYEVATFRHVVEVNLTGVMSVCVHFHDALAARRGAVILVGSLASFVAVPGQPAYSASKGGLRTLVKSLADAWSRDGIRVNAIAPGFVATKMTTATIENERALQATIERIPLGRWGTAAEMGAAALFLASDMSSYVTGQMLPVDGGFTIR